MRTVSLVLILIIALAADAVTGFSSTVGQTNITCPAGQFVNKIGTADTCATPADKQFFLNGNITITMPANATTTGGIDVQLPFPFNTRDQINVTASFSSNPLGGTIVQQSDDVSLLTGSGNTSAIWTKMPLATTELFGKTQNRLSFFETSTTLYALSVDVVTAGSANAVLELQMSPDLVTWTDPCRGNADVSISSTGLKQAICSPILINPGGFAFLRVVGKGGNGVVSPSFGTIQASFVSTLQLSASLLAFCCEITVPGLMGIIIDISIPVPNAVNFVVNYHVEMCVTPTGSNC